MITAHRPRRRSQLNQPRRAPSTFTSEGGAVRADCTPTGLARLLSWTPAKPYKAEQVTAGPAHTAAVTFKHGNRTVTMAVTCRRP